MKPEELKSVVKPQQLISVETAKLLNSNYNAKRADLHLKAIGKEDANAVWYSLDELENYIEYIKNEGEQQGLAIDGIRFYLGVYPETETKGKAGYTTIFLSPTKASSVEEYKTTELEINVGVSQDITSIEPLNFGSMGNPPKMEYGG